MNYSEEDAIALINDFFSKMHNWGLRVISLYKNENGGPQENQERMREELRIIYNDFLTKKVRKNGRLEVMSVSIGSPDYDPLLESVDKIEVGANGFLIFTKKKYSENNYFEDYRYLIKKTGDGLRIDYKERFSSYENKWIKQVI